MVPILVRDTTFRTIEGAVATIKIGMFLTTPLLQRREAVRAVPPRVVVEAAIVGNATAPFARVASKVRVAVVIWLAVGRLPMLAPTSRARGLSMIQVAPGVLPAPTFLPAS